MEAMEELAYVQAALRCAAADPGQSNRNRSREFVKKLANAFRERFKTHGHNTNFCVLSRDNGDHRGEFGLNELLYDILVCEVGTVESARHSRALTFIRRTIWQIESEFSSNSRKALFDFNKLVLGSAQYKLFIGPKTSNDEQFLKSLFPAAQCCSGVVFAALASPPAKWSKAELSVKLWRADPHGWVPLQEQSPNPA